MSNEEIDEEALKRQVNFWESTLRGYLSKDALTRYFTIKSTNPNFALQILAFVYEAVNQKYIKGQLSDKEFKELLIKLQQPKKEFRINMSKYKKWQE